MMLNIGANISFGGITASMAGTAQNFDHLSIINSLADIPSAIFGGPPIEAIISGTAGAPWPVMCGIIFMLVMGIINLRKRKMLNGALMSGKICTTVLFVSMIILVLYPNVSSGALSLLVSLCVLAMLLSFAEYFMAYFGKHKKVQDI